LISPVKGLAGIKELDMLLTMTELATRPPDGRGQRLTYLVKRLEMAERARMEEVLRPLDVTLHQYTALSILERREGLSSAQLARRHVVTPQAMHQLVATMERDGLIERRPDEANRRILRAWLTDHGAEVLRSCHRVVDVLEGRMLSALTTEETEAFGSALERCLAALTEPAPDRGDPG
jgi:DNA-binding MarR family transcriptional regulator